MRWAAVFIFALMLGAENIAFADCTPANNLVAPHQRATWVEGGLVYDTTADTLKTCDGTNYTEISGGGGGSGWTEIHNATPTATSYVDIDITGYSEISWTMTDVMHDHTASTTFYPYTLVSGCSVKNQALANGTTSSNTSTFSGNGRIFVNNFTIIGTGYVIWAGSVTSGTMSTYFASGKSGLCTTKIRFAPASGNFQATGNITVIARV